MSTTGFTVNVFIFDGNSESKYAIFNGKTTIQYTYSF